MENKQPQPASDSFRLRSQDEGHKIKQNIVSYGLGRSLSPSSSVLGSPLSQSCSPCTGKSHSTFSPRSPSHHQAYGLETPPYSPVNDRKQPLASNKAGKGKAADGTRASGPGHQLHAMPEDPLVASLAGPQYIKMEDGMCVDQPVASETAPRTSQMSEPFKTQSYRSPQVESDSEEESAGSLDHSFLFDRRTEYSNDRASPKCETAPAEADGEASAGTPEDMFVNKEAPQEQVRIFSYEKPPGYTEEYYPFSTAPSTTGSPLKSSPALRPSAARIIMLKKPPLTPKATEDDARRHQIPSGYSLKNWDPSEEPILLLGSVFDANSLGKWIYDWTVYHHGLATPVADMAGELWLLLVQLAEKVKRAEGCMPRIRQKENREMIDDFIESGER